MGMDVRRVMLAESLRELNAHRRELSDKEEERMFQLLTNLAAAYVPEKFTVQPSDQFCLGNENFKVVGIPATASGIQTPFSNEKYHVVFRGDGPEFRELLDQLDFLGFLGLCFEQQAGPEYAKKRWWLLQERRSRRKSRNPLISLS